jgi:hypothetical protein
MGDGARDDSSLSHPKLLVELLKKHNKQPVLINKY